MGVEERVGSADEGVMAKRRERKRNGKGEEIEPGRRTVERRNEEGEVEGEV